MQRVKSFAYGRVRGYATELGDAKGALGDPRPLLTLVAHVPFFTEEGALEDPADTWLGLGVSSDGWTVTCHTLMFMRLFLCSC